MILKLAPITVSLSLALALGACGGGEPDSADPTVADPVDAEPLAVETSEPTEAIEPVATATEDVAADVMAEVDEGWTAMQGDWQNSAGLVKDRWADLTEEDILGTGGDRDRLVVLVQEKYGIEREQAEQEVNDWASAL